MRRSRSACTRRSPCTNQLYRVPQMERDLSPVHLHLDSTDIPVNHSLRVHVISPKKSTNESVGRRMSRSTKSSRNKSRSKSPSEHWVPPPGRSSKNHNHKNDVFGTNDLDISRSNLRCNQDVEVEVTYESEDDILKKRDYERKIDTLMGEVACLKNEMYLQHGGRSTAETEPHDMISKCVGFNETEDILMTKLVEVEMDGQQAAKQVAALADSLRRMQQQERILPGSDLEMISKQRKLVLGRLVDFERSNRVLRRLLRDTHAERMETTKLREQREILLNNLANTEHNLQAFQSESIGHLKTIEEYETTLQMERDSLQNAMARQSSLDSTKAHLQKQLKIKESDCNRMAVQIHGLEGTISQERILHNRLSMERTKAENDKDSLKKAARAQKLRATHSEEAMVVLEAKLVSKDALVEDLSRKVANYDGEIIDSSKHHSSISAENCALKTRINELESLLTRLETDSKFQVEDLTTELERRSKETSNARDQARDAKATKTREDLSILQIEAEIEKKKSTILKETKDFEIDKLETQTRELDGLRMKLKNSQEESRNIGSKLYDIDRKMNDLERQNVDLINAMSKSEDSTHQYRVKYEDTSRENMNLSRQLEASIYDVKHISDTSREKSITQVRASQSRILDLETQLNQNRSDLIKAKRERDEVERKTSNKVVDLKDRLEQAHSTNRSMQNYVQFLKNSYSNVFSSVDNYSLTNNAINIHSKPL